MVKDLEMDWETVKDLVTVLATGMGLEKDLAMAKGLVKDLEMAKGLVKVLAMVSVSVRQKEQQLRLTFDALMAYKHTLPPSCTATEREPVVLESEKVFVLNQKLDLAKKQAAHLTVLSFVLGRSLAKKQVLHLTASLGLGLNLVSYSMMGMEYQRRRPARSPLMVGSR